MQQIKEMRELWWITEKKGVCVVRGGFLGGKKDLIPVSRQEFWNYCLKIQKIKSSLKYNFVWDQHQVEIHRVLLKMSKKVKKLKNTTAN